MSFSKMAILPSLQQCVQFPVVPHPCQCLVLSNFLFCLSNVYNYFIMPLICISLITHDVAYHFYDKIVKI